MKYIRMSKSTDESEAIGIDIDTSSNHESESSASPASPSKTTSKLSMIGKDITVIEKEDDAKETSPKSDRSMSPMSNILIPIVKIEEMPRSLTGSLKTGKRVRVDITPDDKNKRRKVEEMEGEESDIYEMEGEESNKYEMEGGEPDQQEIKLEEDENEPTIKELIFNNMDALPEGKRRSRGKPPKREDFVYEYVQIAMSADVKEEEEEPTSQKNSAVTHKLNKTNRKRTSTTRKRTGRVRNRKPGVKSGTKRSGTDLEQGFVEDKICSYAVIEKGTQRGSQRLVGSDGFTYNIRDRKVVPDRLDWRCSHRPRGSLSCSVVVRQYKSTNVYMKKGEHCHQGQQSAFVSALVTSEIKKRIKQGFRKKSKAVIEDILKENAELISQSGYEFNVDYLVRNFNRGKQSLVKENPSLKDKEKDTISKEFLLSVVSVVANNHLLYATKKQLQLLARTDRWFIDVTRKFVNQPYTCLLSISAYVDQGLEKPLLKLKPLAFALMSSSSMRDFNVVIRGFLARLVKPIAVRSFVLDYSEGLWAAMRKIFFNCKLYGCAWKFGQCMWANIQKLGLQEEQAEMYDQIHRLLKLPFVPSKCIIESYELLKSEFMMGPAYEILVNYIESTWLYNRKWRLSNWSVYMSPFRTKAEVIGWHYMIHLPENTTSEVHLMKDLYKIAKTIPANGRTMSQLQVRRFYRESGNTTPQGRIFQLWETQPYISKSEFLEKCCQFSEPTMDGMLDRMVQEYRSQMKEYS